MKKNVIQNIGTVTAIVISIIALCATFYEANIMKTQQQAMVWPYFKIEPRYNADGYGLVAYNNGTGPAVITSVELTIDGAPVKNFDEMLDKIKPDRKIGYGSLRMGSLNNSVFRAGQEEEILFMPWTDETKEITKELYHRMQLKVQFKSVLGEHWLFNFKTSAIEETSFISRLEFQN